MKTRYFILSLAILASWSCSQTALRPGSDDDCLRAVIEEDLAVTKSQLLDVPGIRLESVWQVGDQIGVFGSNASNVGFKVAEGDLSKDRKTADFRTDGTIPSEKVLSSKRVGRYEIMDIRAGQLNEQTKSGVGAECAFASGKVYTWDLVFINKSSGKVLTSNDREHFALKRYRVWGG